MTALAALDASAKTMETGFAGVVEQLSAVRGGMMDLVSRLVDLDRVLTGQRAQDRVIDLVGEAVRGVKDAIGGASAVAAPPRVISAAIAAQDAVAAIETQTRMLDAVANLSLITARSLGLDRFDDYVGNLRALGDAIRRDAASVSSAVAALRRRRSRAHALFTVAGNALDEVSAAVVSLTADRTQTSHALTATIDGVGAVANRVPRLLSEETDALVRAIQFADAAAQRIDHIRIILSRGGMAERALAAAQIHALVMATRTTVSDARESLSRIDTAIGEAGRILSDEGQTQAHSSTAAVELGRRLLTAIVQASERALEAIGVASDESAALEGLSAEAAQRFTFLAKASGEIHIAAINATLLARTENGQERAMSVLSIDVQQQAAACSRSADECKMAMRALTLPDDLTAFVAVFEKAQVFRRSMQATSDAVTGTGVALDEIAALRRSATDSILALDAALRDAQACLDRIEETADNLSHLAEDLPRTPPPGSGPLADVLDLYTMEAERAVHRLLFGLAEGKEPAVPSARLFIAQTGCGDSDADLLASVLF